MNDLLIKHRERVIIALAMSLCFAANTAFAQGFAGAGGNLGTGIGAELVADLISWVVVAIVNCAPIYHGVSLLASGHRMQAIAEMGCGLVLLGMRSTIVGYASLG